MEHRVLIDNIDLNYPEFVELHDQDYYGSSEVANICGVGYSSALEVWLRKTGKADPIEQTDQMLLGKLAEPALATLLARRLNSPIASVNQVWQHPTLDWYIASPDATIMDEQKLIEFKTHKIYAEKYWSDTQASDSAHCQLQWQLGVDSSFSGGYCAALIGGDTEKFFYPYFDRDDALISQMVEQVENFRELVRTDTPPNAGPGDAAEIKKHIVNGIDKSKEIDLTESHSELLSEYEDLELKKKEIEPKLKELDAKIKAIKNQFVQDSQGSGIIKVGKGFVKLSHIVTKERTVKGSDYFKVYIKVS